VHAFTAERDREPNLVHLDPNGTDTFAFAKRIGDSHGPASGHEPAVSRR
jgi:hypothetical protein